MLDWLLLTKRIRLVKKLLPKGHELGNRRLGLAFVLAEHGFELETLATLGVLKGVEVANDGGIHWLLKPYLIVVAVVDRDQAISAEALKVEARQEVLSLRAVQHRRTCSAAARLRRSGDAQALGAAGRLHSCPLMFGSPCSLN